MLSCISAVSLLSVSTQRPGERPLWLHCNGKAWPRQLPIPHITGEGAVYFPARAERESRNVSPVSSSHSSLCYSPARIQAFHDADPDPEIFASIKDLLQLITVVLHPFSQDPCLIRQHFQKVLHPERAGSLLSVGNQAHIFHRR